MKQNKKGFNIKKVLLVLLLVVMVVAIIPFSTAEPIKYIERDSGEIKVEKVAGEQWLSWLYHNPVGEATLWTLAKRKIVSDMYGELMDKPASTDRIEPFVEEFNIDMSLAREKEFNSFNDFFIRKLKPKARPIDTVSTAIVSPADGKVLAYQNLENSNFIIKGYRFNVASFLKDSALARQYQQGSLIIVRLAPPDYHRYHFPVSGKVIKNIKITGDYYSVNPIALREKAEIFWLNKREYTVIETQSFGPVIMAEVGATMVGSMVQTFPDNLVEKGEEKGYFKFGGSTVVLLFKENEIEIDKDLIEHTKKGLETTVKMGEKIAEQKMF